MCVDCGMLWLRFGRCVRLVGMVGILCLCSSVGFVMRYWLCFVSMCSVRLLFLSGGGCMWIVMLIFLLIMLMCWLVVFRWILMCGYVVMNVVIIVLISELSSMIG